MQRTSGTLHSSSRGVGFVQKEGPTRSIGASTAGGIPSCGSDGLPEPHLGPRGAEPAPAAPQAPAIVSGVFVDSAGNPIAHGVLSVVGESLRVVTDSQGRFRLAVPPGPTLLAARALGYQPLVFAISLEPGQSTVRQVHLQVAGVPLPEMTVVGQRYVPARLAGFVERRQRGLGLFLDRDSIEKRPRSEMSDLFVGRAGIRVFQDPYDPTKRHVLFTRCEEMSFGPGAGGAHTGNRIGVYIDGSRLPGSSSSDAASNLALINPADAEAIEVYRGPSELPAEFMTDNCAAIVIWTRAGPR